MSKCDLKCPQVSGIIPPAARCCAWCSRERKEYVNEANRHLWDERRGFLRESGCLLGRDEMPQECRDYDCKTIPWMVCSVKYSPLVWDGKTWRTLQPIECRFVGMMDRTEELLNPLREIIEKHNREIESEIKELLNDD